MIGPPFVIVSICKGGGYRYCRTHPRHPRANPMGLYPLHRVLVENEIGRLLDPKEHVHHMDEDTTNDSITNLQVLTAAEHARLHRTKDPVRLLCPTCESEFSVPPHIFRLRVKRNKSGLIFCSRACGVKRAA
jgi:hypothetical protein